ncbi:hypothetical protein KUA24_141 [Vibrio phage HNL01]|nr:hypothetical protein KUA24_141 [Vibrio phage HNL01]
MSYTCEEMTPALAAVTEHLVDEVARAMPDEFMKGNEVNTLKVLHFLGMYTSKAKGDGEGYYNGGVTFYKDQVVRNTDKPYLTYRCGVYRGLVRKEVIGSREVTSFETNPETEEVYPVRKIKNIVQHHKMVDVYEKYGTLQAQNIGNYVKESDMVNIMDGYREAY